MQYLNLAMQERKISLSVQSGAYFLLALTHSQCLAQGRHEHVWSKELTHTPMCTLRGNPNLCLDSTPGAGKHFRSAGTIELRGALPASAS